jgi:hypothetical protein
MEIVGSRTPLTDPTRAYLERCDAVYDAMQEAAERLGGPLLVQRVAELAFPEGSDDPWPNAAAIERLNKYEPGVSHDILLRAEQISFERIDRAAKPEYHFLSEKVLKTLFAGAVSIFGLNGSGRRRAR